MFEKIKGFFKAGAIAGNLLTSRLSHEENGDLAHVRKTQPRSLLPALRRTYQWRTELAMKNWRTAVDEAENPYRPRRLYLYGLYHEAINDLHLLAQLRTARITVLRAPFQIVKANKPNKNLLPLFESPWFRHFLQLALDAEFYGHSLIEFSPIMENGEFKELLLIPREHVRPETGTVVVNPLDEIGVPYRDATLSKYLIEVGDPDDLGLLKAASKEVIRKQYSMTDWSRRSEKFGMPFVALRSNTRNEKELDERARMLANLGSNSWAIFDEGEEIEFHESQNGSGGGHLIYMDLAKFCDEQISKLINGQTGTQDAKSFVGAAEVHERILNDYTFDRLRRLQDIINHKLIPFLSGHGYSLKGTKFEFTELLPKADPSADNNPDDKGTTGKIADEKKKLTHESPHDFSRGKTFQEKAHDFSRGAEANKLFQAYYNNLAQHKDCNH